MMSSTTVFQTIDVLWKMFATHGLPEQQCPILDPKFTSSEFAHFLRQNRVKHVCSAPYHHSTNGLAERFVQSMKQSLMAT